MRDDGREGGQQAGLSPAALLGSHSWTATWRENEAGRRPQELGLGRPQTQQKTSRRLGGLGSASASRPVMTAARSRPPSTPGAGGRHRAGAWAAGHLKLSPCPAGHAGKGCSPEPTKKSAVVLGKGEWNPCRLLHLRTHVLEHVAPEHGLPGQPCSHARPSGLPVPALSSWAWSPVQVCPWRFRHVAQG